MCSDYESDDDAELLDDSGGSIIATGMNRCDLFKTDDTDTGNTFVPKKIVIIY